MESHYKEYNKNKAYNRREIENDMKENYKDFLEKKK